MAKKAKFSSDLKGMVLLVGYDKNGKCVFTKFISDYEYYDGDSLPFDDAKQIKALSLHSVHGFIFGSRGEAIQQFESQFNAKTGNYQKGWRRDETGKITKD